MEIHENLGGEDPEYRRARHTKPIEATPRVLCIDSDAIFEIDPRLEYGRNTRIKSCSHKQLIGSVFIDR